MLYNNKMNTNACVDKTSVRPSNWDENIAKQYEVGKVIDTTGWNYLDNFSKLNMYEGWSYVCADCNVPIRQCIANETLNFKAEDWGNYLKKIVSVPESNTQSETKAPVYRQKNGVKGRKKTTVDITEDMIDEIISFFKEKGLVYTAKEYNLNPGQLSAKLKSMGIEVRKGKKKSTV